MGWSQSAAVPDLESDSFVENVKRRNPRKWPRLRPWVESAILQVPEFGDCLSFE
jgi:hypothetical protein